MKAILFGFILLASIVGNVTADTQHIKCGDDSSGFELTLVLEGDKIALNESSVDLKGDLSPDWGPIGGQIEKIEKDGGNLVLSVGSWSAANDDPYNFDVTLTLDTVGSSFKRSEGVVIEADGTQNTCYSYIESN